MSTLRLSGFVFLMTPVCALGNTFSKLIFGVHGEDCKTTPEVRFCNIFRLCYSIFCIYNLYRLCPYDLYTHVNVYMFVYIIYILLLSLSILFRDRLSLRFVKTFWCRNV